MAWRLLGAAIVAAALVGQPAARAGTIAMSVEIGTGPVTDLSTFGGVGTANGYVMDAAAIVALDAFLAADGYLFTTIGGASNFPGTHTPERGHLSMDGFVVAGTGSAALTLSETESGFTAPPPYYLLSSSTGNFTNQPAGGGQTVSTSFNGGSTLTYSLLSDGVAPNKQIKTTPYEDIPVVIPYTISNSIAFGLASGATDNFSVTGTVVPEPSTWAMMLIGFVGLGFMLRHGVQRYGY